MAPIVLTVEARLKRTGIEKRMVLGNGLEAATADPSLLRLIARAHGIRARLFDDTTLSLKEITKEEDVVGSYVTRLLRLSFLAPDIVAPERRATGGTHREPVGSMEEPASRLDRTAQGSGLHLSGPTPMAQASEPSVVDAGRLGSCFALPDQEMAPVARDGGTAKRRKRDVCARTLSQTAPKGLCPQSKLANTPERPRDI